MTSTIQEQNAPSAAKGEFVPPPRTPKTSARGWLVVVAIVTGLVLLGGGTALGAFAFSDDSEKVVVHNTMPGSCKDALLDALLAFQQYDVVTGKDEHDVGQWGDFLAAYDQYWADPNDNGQGIDAMVTQISRSFGTLNDQETTFLDDLDRCGSVTQRKAGPSS